MNKSEEYHLLYVLSEPHVPVVHRKPHGWSVGDILSAEKNPAFHRSDRFLVFDVSRQGRGMALKISEISNTPLTDGEYVSLGPDGLNVPEVAMVEGSYVIRLDKVYFEAAITGKSHGPDWVKVGKRFSPGSMDAVMRPLNARIYAFTSIAQSLESGFTSPSTDRSLTVGSSTESAKSNTFEKRIATGHDVQIFLDYAHMTFDKADYIRLREFIELPPKTRYPEMDDIGCACFLHMKRKKRTHDDHSKKFWATWKKMEDCAEMLRLKKEPCEILRDLSSISQALGCQPGDHILHQTFSPKPCYILDLPTELLLNIVECFSEWDSGIASNLGLTCRSFNELVNFTIYRSIAVNAGKWNKLVYNLPKYGIHTREIYLESSHYSSRNSFENLRAIGDFCPNLVRLDFVCPLRLDISATEADLPPKIITETVAHEGGKGQNVITVDEDVEMPDVQEATLDGATTAESTGDQMDAQADAQVVPAMAHVGGDSGANAQVAAPAIAQDGANGGDGQDGGNGEDGGDDDGDDDGDITDSDDDDHGIIPGREAGFQDQKRVCAEIDHILKNCPLLQNFSMQWTGHLALKRFHQRIPSLKGIRIWDRIEDKDLIAMAKACRDLERVYIDDRAHGFNLVGLIGFVTGLRTKGKSKLKRFGLRHPLCLQSQDIEDVDDMDMDDDDDDGLDDDGVGDGDGGGLDGDGAGIGDGGDGDGDGDGDAMPAFFAPLPLPQPVLVDPRQTPMFKFLDVLSEKHPFLERLCLSHCQITDNIVSKFGALTRLKSLDVSHPLRGTGLSAVGISELVSVFRGKSLSALDLSAHLEMSDDDIQILTGAEGLKSLRYIKFRGCPKLTANYIMQEWVHTEDFIIEDGAWSAAGKSSLEIGEGWKENWSD